LFLERPTFGELATRCTQLNITASYCDVSGKNPNEIIPRNWGEGPGFFNVNLRIGKTFGFGKSADSAAQGSQQGGQGGGNRGPGGPGGGRGGRGPGGGGGGNVVASGPGFFAFFSGSDTRKPYNLNLSINFSNLFNTVNFASPVGNLASSRFGQYVSTIGGFGGFGGFGGGSANRRIELQARFSW
jgi:hypothetical protein